VTSPSRLVPRLVAVMVTLLVVFAPPALAHDSDDDTPPGLVGDLRSSLLESTLPPGVEVRLLENGEALWLRNTGRTPVIVFDDEGGSRYLVGPQGLAVNDALPVRDPDGDRDRPHQPPAPVGQPRWRWLSHDSTVQWQDHTTQWDQGTPPAAAEQGRDHLIRAWQVGLRQDGRPYEIRGEWRWIPGPSPLPWIALTALMAVGVALLARSRRKWLLAVPMVVLVTAGASHATAMILGRDAENAGVVLLHDYLPVLAALLIGLSSIVLLAAGLRNARWFATLAAAGLGAKALVLDSAVWWSSTSVVAVPVALDRFTVAVSAGIAVGLVVALLTWPAASGSAGATPPPR